MLAEQLDEWMDAFHKLLVFNHPGIAAADAAEPDREGVLDALKTAVCANINLLLEVEDEDFEKYVQTFTQDVWHTLMQVGKAVG